MKRILFVVLSFLASPLQGAPLTAWQNLPYATRTQIATDGLFVKGNADNNWYALEVDPATGALPVQGTFVATPSLLLEDHGYGTVGPGTTLRTAAQIGNATGAADFGTGSATAQTLRTTVANFPATQPVSGSVSVSNFPATQAVTQSTSPWIVSGSGTAGTPATGVVSIQGVAGGVAQAITATSLPLPTGAATSAIQATQQTSLSSIDTKTPTQGQTTSAASSPVVIASDQSKLPVAVPDSTTTATITASGQTVVVGPFNGLSSWSVSLSGTFSAGSTVTWEVSDDNTNWTAVNGRQTGTGNGVAILTTTASGGVGNIFYRGNAGGVAYFRVRCTAFQTSDAIVVTAKVGGGVGAVFLNSAIPGGINNIGFVSAAGKAKNVVATLDYSTTNVGNAAYVQLVASTSLATTKLYPFDSSGAVMILAVGGAGSEVDQLYIPPGGSGAGYELAIPAGSRISLKVASFASNPVNVTNGFFVLTGLN